MSDPDLHHWIERWRSGDLDAEALSQLEHHLRHDATARQHFRQICQFDATLRDWAASRTASPWPSWHPSDPPAPRSRSRIWYATHPGVVLATAAAIAVLASLASYLLGDHRASSHDLASGRAEESSTGVAVLTRLWDATFQALPGQSPPRVGDTLAVGTLVLQQGMAQIEFFSGATLLLEGAAEIDLRSAWEASCLSGNARVRVPPPARGFRLNTPGMNLVDLGTEFGVRVNALNGEAEVHVFEGEVEAHPGDALSSLLTSGQSLLRQPDGATLLQPANTALFTSIETMDAHSHAHAQQRFDAWWHWTQSHRHDPRLLAYYLFKHWPEDRWDRLVNNFTEPKNPAFSGGAVGVKWTQGRWPMKDALEFKGPGDRVRVLLDCETFDALTFSTWVRVDGLDRRYNALLLTDGYEEGEPHWQIDEDGRLMFSILYANPGSKPTRQNQIYLSPPIFTLANQRRWHHLAVTYENQSGVCIQYLDGQPVSREVSDLHQPNRPISLGPAEIGNWGLPTKNHTAPIRNLNGRIDEFAIYKAALSGPEIADLYQQGRPD